MRTPSMTSTDTSRISVSDLILAANDIDTNVVPNETSAVDQFNSIDKSKLTKPRKEKIRDDILAKLTDSNTKQPTVC